MRALAWMLDTNTLSDLIRNPGGTCARQVISLPAESLCTSIVVACEFRYGAHRKGSSELRRRVEHLLRAILVLPLDPPVDEHYADIRNALESVGTPIGSHDLLIASHARSRNLTLVTHNVHEFQRVPGLKVEDWMATGIP